MNLDPQEGGVCKFAYGAMAAARVFVTLAKILGYYC